MKLYVLIGIFLFCLAKFIHAPLVRVSQKIYTTLEINITYFALSFV